MATITAPNDINNNSNNSGVSIDTNFEILYGNDQAINTELGTVKARTEIVNGVGHAPAGTPVKMSWFEGTTNSSGNCTIPHGLGSNILGFSVWVLSAGQWYNLYYDLSFTSGSGVISYNSTELGVRFQFSSIFENKSVRFLVWHK